VAQLKEDLGKSEKQRKKLEEDLAGILKNLESL